MDLLGGYHSSSSDDDGDEKKHPKAAQAAVATVGQQSRSTPELVSSLRRPPPGALNAAPLPSVPLAVLRSQGALVGGPSSSAMVVASKTANNSGPIQGPVALHDPNDKTVR